MCSQLQPREQNESYHRHMANNAGHRHACHAVCWLHWIATTPVKYSGIPLGQILLDGRKAFFLAIVRHIPTVQTQRCVLSGQLYPESKAFCSWKFVVLVFELVGFHCTRSLQNPPARHIGYANQVKLNNSESFTVPMRYPDLVVSMHDMCR